jgi:SAM-dependent methyltransferase
MNSYYSDKLETLKDIFGIQDVILSDDHLIVDGRRYPIVDDVIIALEPSQIPTAIRSKIRETCDSGEKNVPFAADIQSTFAREWETFPDILPEHESEFEQYFDLVNVDELHGKRIADLGCGIGRWSYFVKEFARELVLVDFSEAIFVARRNLRHAPQSIFLMADVQRLPFRDDFADFILCLGVLHHLPINALNAVRQISRLAPSMLIYLYSALDRRPMHYRLLLGPVNLLRSVVCNVQNAMFRKIFTWITALFLYMPFIALGHFLKLFRLSHLVPIFDFYHGKSLRRIRQDAYDRFFTRIEQRFSREEIHALVSEFDCITISDHIPMWHFLCEREADTDAAYDS